MKESRSSQSYPCPCCNNLTLGENPPGTFEICEVCGWEDDNVQFEDPDFRGGANFESLKEARTNYREFGAINRNKIVSVRRPNEDEVPRA